jgi:chromosome segregation ATPase
LRIRPEYFNQDVRCKYCDHVFRARLSADNVNPPANAEKGGTAQPAVGLEAELKSLQGQLATRTAETDTDEIRRHHDRSSRKKKSRHIRITCPNCQRPDLRIRPEYMDHDVRCKHCEHVFRPGLSVANGSLAASAEKGGTAQPAVGLEAELKSLRDELATRTAEHASANVRLEEAEGQRRALPDQMHTLQEQIDETVSKARDEEALRRQGENARAEQIRDLEETARRAQAEMEELRAELEGHREREAANTKTLQLNEELCRERDRFAAERDRLRDEVAAVRAEHEAHVAAGASRLAQLEAGRDAARAEHEAHVGAGASRLAQLETERDAARAGEERLTDEAARLKVDRDRLEEELRSVRTELEGQAADVARLGSLSAELEARGADRDRLEAERQQAASEAEQLRSWLEELERSLAAAIAEHEDARGLWELERRQLQERCEVERQAARGREEASPGALETEADRLRREIATLVQEHQRSVEMLRRELESERQGRQELDAARSESERDGDTLRAESERLRAEREDARRRVDALAVQCDQLDHKLADAQATGAETRRHRNELAAQLQALQTALEKQRQDREAEGQEHAKQCDALRQERDAERRRNAPLEAARVLAEKAAKSVREQAGQLRAAYDRLQTQYADLTVKHQVAEGEHRAERDRLTAALARAAEQVAAAAQRNAEPAPMVTGKAAQTSVRRRLADATEEYLASIARTDQRESDV